MPAQPYLLAMTLLPACSLAGEPSMATREVITMGTSLRVRAAGDHAHAAAEQAIRRIYAAERRWSRWDPESQLSKLHRTPTGRPVAVDAAFLDGLAVARRWSARTGGAFDPEIGALVEAWGIDRGGRASPPSATELARAPLAGFTIRGSTIARTHPRAQLAAGGFAKGLALDAAIAVAVADPGLDWIELDLGGQLAWWSRNGTANSGHAEPPRQAGIAHPRHRHQVVASIDRPRVGALATSGDSERGIDIGGVRHSHILDPRTRRPAPGWGSVTVLTTDATDDPGCAADCLSTALFVLGPERGLALAETLPNIEALFLEQVGDSLRWHMTAGMRSRLRRIDHHLNPR